MSSVDSFSLSTTESYFLIAQLKERRIDVLSELHGARKSDFRKGKRLGVKDHIVSWKKPVRPDWMSKEQYENYADEITIREIKAGGKTLATTMENSKEARRMELKALFCKRWDVELDLRNIKTTLGMDMLSRKSVEMCHKETWVHMLGYNLIRLLMAQAGSLHVVNPRELSFKHTLQLWLKLDKSKIENRLIEEQLKLIVAKRVGNRSGRVEPRAIKRRPKPYPRLKVPRNEARENVRIHGHDWAVV